MKVFSRRASQPLSGSWAAAPVVAGAALTAAHRTFASRIIDSLGAKVSTSVEQLTKQAAFADDRMVTESRRKLDRFHSAPETLAERLAAQRSIRRFVIPTDIKIDKSRTAIEFTWPEEAVAAGAQLDQEESAFRSSQRRLAGEGVDGSALVREGSAVRANAAEAAAAAAKAPLDTPHSDGSTATPGEKDKGTEAANPTPWLRTRALAEFLRVYTPSTDGRYGMPRQPIYGRRGLTITDVYPVGNYALRFSFSDGHTGGLYSYEYLYFLTSPANKYGLMREYVRDLRVRKKSREPPKRAPSRRRVPTIDSSAPLAEEDLGVGRKAEKGDGGEGSHLAPAFGKERR